MTCKACTEAATVPWTHSFQSDCLECKARALAHGQAYWSAAKDDAMTPDYKKALVASFGEDWLQWHKRVQHYAALLEVKA